LCNTQDEETTTEVAATTGMKEQFFLNKHQNVLLENYILFLDFRAI
jgi:hypothetical protein